MEQCLLVLVVKPSIENAVIDWLLEHDDISGFTSIPISGHGVSVHSMTIAEQVAGQKRLLKQSSVLGAWQTHTGSGYQRRNTAFAPSTDDCFNSRFWPGTVIVRSGSWFRDSTATGDCCYRRPRVINLIDAFYTAHVISPFWRRVYRSLRWNNVCLYSL